MSEGIFTLIGAAIGFFGAVYTAKIGRNKDLTDADIKAAIEGADRNVYREVEQLNRLLKKEISDENIKHQNKWEQKRIDANIISKSRIDWIQKVRIISSEFVSDLYDYKNENKVTVRYEIKRKSELLKLYFNSVSIEESDLSTDKLIEILKSEESNEHKNGYLNIYISRLSEAMTDIEYLRKRDEINKRISTLNDDFFSYEEPVIEVLYEEQADEEIEFEVERLIPEDKQEEAGEVYKKILDQKRKIETLDKELADIELLVENFVDIISIYLKIEWDKAKKGE